MSTRRERAERAALKILAELMARVNRKVFSQVKRIDNLEEIYQIIDSLLIETTDTVGSDTSQVLYQYAEMLYNGKAKDMYRGYQFGRADREFLNIMENVNYTFFNGYTTAKADALKEAIEAMRSQPSMSTKDIQANLAIAFNAQNARDIAYTKNLLATNGTWATSISATNVLIRVNATKYKYIVTLDEATTSFCRNLVGKTNEVVGAAQLADGFKQVGNMNEAEAKAWFKANSPMISETDNGYSTAGAIGTQTYTKEQIMEIPGIELPPFHYGCRTEIGIV